MLKEGVVNITPEETKNVDRYFADIKRYTDKLFKKFKEIEANDLSDRMTSYSKSIQPKYNLNNIEISYLHLTSHRYKGGFKPLQNTIIINTVTFFVSNSTTPDGDKNVSSILYDGIREAFDHEYVHYKQNELHKQSTGASRTAYSSNDWVQYLKQPWEQMAFAAEELRWIKNKLKGIKPDELVRYLQKWGLTRNQKLANLKKTDYESWKGIMKNAAMFALQDMAKKSGTPTKVKLP